MGNEQSNSKRAAAAARQQGLEEYRGRQSRSMTVDERHMLSVSSRRQDTDMLMETSFPKMKRAVTFVNKKHVNQVKPLTLDDIMFRKHFNAPEENAQAHPVVHEVSIAPQPTSGAARLNKAVVVVDTFSTGAMVAYIAYTLGYKVVCVLSGDLGTLASMVPDGLDFSYEAVITRDDSNGVATGLKNALVEINALNIPIVAVIPGAETGVEFADELSVALGCRTNGTEQSDARRNKFIMGEAVRSAGLRAVKQKVATSWNEIAEFIENWNPDPFKVIVKPMDSAGSDDVTLCASIEEVQAAFGNIMGKKNGLGLINKCVLVQEYLEGQEYVIDMVSRDGVHKLVAIWEYDKRKSNGAPFVLHGQRIMIMADNAEKYEKIIAYQRSVLTALGVVNGPSHGEVKWCKGEPVLVEVGARCHGGDGLWVEVAQQAAGRDQAREAVNAYVGNDLDFENLPSEPIERLKFGAMKYLVSFVEGTLEKYNPAAIQEITEMPSYLGHQLFLKEGQPIHKTVNLFTWVGGVKLAHADKEQLEKDYARIEELAALEENGLYMLKKDSPAPPAEKSIAVIVDPFSTGACLAADFAANGYAIVCVYSGDMDKLGSVQNLLPQGVTLNFEAVVPFDDDISVMVAALRALDGTLRVLVPGAETGVELADGLSEALGLRTNGTSNTECRRNKYVMGETVRNAGIRAVKQKTATTWEEIEAFIGDWNPDPFKVIVKPMDSAGSEDVTLCFTMEEVQAAFKVIYGKKNGLGLINKCVLVQEYLEGQEYVIDMASRDGVHKVISIWEYDRVPHNGAKFVNQGQKLMLMSDDPEKFTQLCDYQKKVSTALGILNGPSHGEVKWFKGEPVLVEVGARCHGSEGAWIGVADAVLKCNQASATVAAYTSQEAFDKLPDLPTQRFGDGRLLFLICGQRGTLQEINADLIEELRQMKSFVRMEVFNKLGTFIVPTINCFTYGGLVVLINEDTAQLEADYKRIHEMDENIFIVA